jgi:SAM-dependent methyltransferase
MPNNLADENKQYFDYLKTRSFIGNLYRKLFLYPKISKALSGKCLDVGCGIGDMLMHRPNTVGADVNDHNINHCLTLGRQAFFIKDDHLPFEGATFDCALLDNVLEHIEHPQKILAEIKRTLKPNSQLIVGVPGIKGFESDPDHKCFYDESALKRIAKETGFEIKEFFYVPLFKSSFLSNTVRQYCIYSVWQKI